MNAARLTCKNAVREGNEVDAKSSRPSLFALDDAKLFVLRRFASFLPRDPQPVPLARNLRPGTRVRVYLYDKSARYK